ncbi:MAG TPA: AraC family transcriptional regulator [Flavobacteriales bacterium]
MEPYPKAYLYKRIVQAKLLMDERFSEPIDGELICGEAAFSQSHFIRLFKQVYGVVPRVYLSNLRLERAKQLLEQGMGVTDACSSVGFRSLPTFSRAFKRYTGSAPTVFQQVRAERAKHIVEQPMDHIPSCYAQWLGWPQIRDPG